MLRAPCVPLLVLGLSATCFLANAEQPSRIHQHHITDEQTFTLQGNIHPLTTAAVDAGQVDSSLALPRVTIHFALTRAQQVDLTQLLKNLQDRSSPLYHHFLTTAQYRDRFGLSSSDMNKVVAWLQSKGFTDVQPSPMRTSITMSGNAAQAQSAFQISLRRYVVNGKEHYANANNPVLPKTLEGMVAGIRGLNDFHPRPRLIRRPHFTSSITGLHFIAPDDFATIYDLHTLYSSGIDGTGVSIAVAGQTDIAVSDIRAFRSAAGLPPNDPTVVLDGTDPGTSSNDVSEADLDIELAGAVARNATIIYVNSTDAFESLQYAIDKDLAPVISVSYGDCEAQTSSGIASLETEFQKANALGITILSAAGDDGAADCDTGTDNKPATIAKSGLAVDYPASSPEVTGVGGTEFTDGSATAATQYWSGSNNADNGSALSYIPETAWNDTSSTQGLSAGGGGASSYFQKPAWQTGPGVPSDNARDVPDVSLTASPAVDPVLYCDSGKCVNGFRNTDTTLDVTGGTSVGAPSFAGLVALINQKAGPQGNINPILYQMAAATTGAFHDITTGNNSVPCQTGTKNCATGGTIGYSAGAGYDQATGLGSVDGTNLVNGWPDYTITLNPTSITIDAGTSANVAVNITRSAHYTDNVTFTCSTSVSNLSCTAPGAIGASGSGSLTITRSSAAAVWKMPSISWKWPASLLLICGSAMLMFRRRRELMWGGAACLLLAAASCGGGSSSPTTSQTVTTPTTGTVTLTATSGTLPESFTINVTMP